MDPEDISETSIERTWRVEKHFKRLRSVMPVITASLPAVCRNLGTGSRELEASFDDNDFKYSTKL